MLPTFAKATTIRSRITLLFKKSRRLSNLLRSLKSFTTGVLSLASTYPATHPAAIAGFNEVIGAATNAVAIDNG